MKPSSRAANLAPRTYAVILSLILVLAIVSIVAFDKGTASSSSTANSAGTSTTSVEFSTTVSTSETTMTYSAYDIQGTTCPNGCVVSVPWASLNRPQQTLSTLTNASTFIFVGIVAAEWTVAYGTVPVTLYNITMTDVLKNSTVATIPTSNGFSVVGEAGGTAANSTVSLEGYPTLNVGGMYVFFVSPAGGMSYGSYAQFPDTPFMQEVDLSFDGAVLMTQDGPQGLFYVQNGNVYSLDNMYPQADSWIPTKVSGVPLSQFVQEIQAASGNSTATSP
jgi:hypothetical protein